MIITLYELNLDMPDPRPNPDGGQVGGGLNPFGFIANMKASIVYEEAARRIGVIGAIASRGNILTTNFLASQYIQTTGTDSSAWDAASSVYSMTKWIPLEDPSTEANGTISIELLEPPGGDRRPNGPEYDAIANINWKISGSPSGFAAHATIDFVRRVSGSKAPLIDLAIALADRSRVDPTEFESLKGNPS